MFGTNDTTVLSPEWRKNQNERLEDLIQSPVPKPSRSYPLSPKWSQSFVNETNDEVEKQKRQKFVQSIIHIPFDQFMNTVCQCACALNKRLQGQEWALNLLTERSYVAEKSSEWVAHIMLSECKLNPPIFVQKKGDLDELCELAIAYRALTQKDLPLVFVDDISYSGTQLRRTLTEYIDRFTDYENETKTEVPIHFHVVLPYIASRKSNEFGKLTLTDQKLEIHECGSVVIIDTKITRENPVIRLYPKFIPFYNLHYPFTLYVSQVFDDFVTTDSSLTTVGDQEVGELSRVYADHKLPDDISIPVKLIAPLIEGCETYYRNPDVPYKEWRSTKCPPPPYKRSHNPREWL